jgi:hypothetical protein
MVEHATETGAVRMRPDGAELVGDLLGSEVPLQAGAVAGLLRHADEVQDHPERPTRWAVYTFRGQQDTPVLESPGPRDIDRSAALPGSLAFGAHTTATLLGQLLTNVDYGRLRSAEQARHAKDASEERDIEAAAAREQKVLERMQDAFSRVLDRRVEVRFELRRVVPRVFFDGEEIPLDLLGEGLRATMAWLADLLVRLELTDWEREDLSPYDQDFWLILDEVEVNLHPRMQARLFPTLRRLFPNARIYATVHSPFAVAAAGEGVVFPIRPDPRTHHVSGAQEAVRLDHGQSLSWVIEEIFDVSAMFLDQETQERLRTHDRDVHAIGEAKPLDWSRFLENRRWLMRLNEEVNTIVAMREVPVRRVIQSKLDEQRP